MNLSFDDHLRVELVKAGFKKRLLFAKDLFTSQRIIKCDTKIMLLKCDTKIMLF